MTVSTTAFRGRIVGAKSIGATQAIGFPLMEPSELEIVEVVEATGVETAMAAGEMENYTVVLSGPAPSDGTITLKTAIAAGSTWYYRRRITKDQQTDYTALDKFPSLAHEQALDKLTLAVQDLDGDRVGALRIPEQDLTAPLTELDMVLPPKEARASKSLGFDADGKPVALAGTVSGSVTVTGFGESLVGAGNPAAGRVVMAAEEAVMTTRGDIMYRNSSNATARLGVGDPGDILTSDGTDVSWSASQAAYHPYFIDGFWQRINAGTGKTEIGVGSCRMHTIAASPVGNTYNGGLTGPFGTRAVAFTKSLVNPWQAGNDQNGCVNSVTANTWYGVFLIAKSSTNDTDICFHTDFTGAGLHGTAVTTAGFNRFRLIGYIKTQTSSTSPNVTTFEPASSFMRFHNPELIMSGSGDSGSVTLPTSARPALDGVDILLNLHTLGDSVGQVQCAVVLGPVNHGILATESEAVSRATNTIQWNQTGSTVGTGNSKGLGQNNTVVVRMDFWQYHQSVSTSTNAAGDPINTIDGISTALLGWWVPRYAV